MRRICSTGFFAVATAAVGLLLGSLLWEALKFDARTSVAEATRAQLHR